MLRKIYDYTRRIKYPDTFANASAGKGELSRFLIVWQSISSLLFPERRGERDLVVREPSVQLPAECSESAPIALLPLAKLEWKGTSSQFFHVVAPLHSLLQLFHLFRLFSPFPFPLPLSRFFSVSFSVYTGLVFVSISVASWRFFSSRFLLKYTCRRRRIISIHRGRRLY